MLRPVGYTAATGRELYSFDPGATTQQAIGGSAVGTPPLLTTSTPRLGSSLKISLTGTPASATSLLVLGFQDLPLPLGGGTWLHCNPAQVIITLPYTGGSLPIPSTPSLDGLYLSLQAITGPTLNPPFGADFSNPVYLKLGY